MSKQNERFPFEFVELSDEQKTEFRKHFAVVQSNVLVGPKRYFMLEGYRRDAHKYYSLPLRPDDVTVCTYPRSGTTWVQELVWLLNNNLDYQKAQQTKLKDRCPFLEFSMFFIGDQSEQNQAKRGPPMSSLEILANCPSPRFIKTHLPLSLLPPTLVDTTKVVYVARDPRDVMVSFYHFNLDNVNHTFTGDFKAFYDLFAKGLMLWAPFFEHVKEAWELKDHPNMLFLFYEDLIMDLEGGIRRVAKFFDKHYTDEQFANLAEYLKFDNFKNNKAVDITELKNAGWFKPGMKFVRKGKAGGWREYFDEELAGKAETWIQENLQGTGLVFPQPK